MRQWLEVDNRGITLIGKYTNNATKTLFRCPHGHEWSAKPSIIKSGHGCPTCASSGFKRDKPGWIYVLIFANYIKYGITNDLERRLKEHLKNGVFELYFSQLYDSGGIAYDLELLIKRTLGGRHVTKEDCPDGWTETLPSHLLEDVIGLLRKNSEIKALDACQGVLL
jgi:hypothetical protein